MEISFVHEGDAEPFKIEDVLAELDALRDLERHLTATAAQQSVETLRLLSAVQLARRYGAKK